MLFSIFADVYGNIMKLHSVTQINQFILQCDKVQSKNELYFWLYIVGTFDKKFKITDKHLLTVFSKIQEPHIDRKNLQEAFKCHGVAETCSKVITFDPRLTSPLKMIDVYNFIKSLQMIPSKSFYLLKHFRLILPYCDRNTLFCLINLIRNSHKNRKLLTKRRNLFLYKQVFGRKGAEQIIENLKQTCNTDVLMETIKFDDYIKPGKPVDSMLAQPCKSFDNILFNEMCVEIKYDGERIQIHKFDDKVLCYKRNLNVTLKCNVLDSIIKSVLKHDVILDCELIGKCVETYEIIVFDILYYNGRSVVNEKLSARKELLKIVVGNETPQMKLIEYVVSSDKEQVAEWVQTVLRLNNLDETDVIEGVVIKHWNGVYEPKRKKWFKMKRSYFKNVCSADLVVVGGWKKNCEKHITIYLVAAPFYDFEREKWMFLPVSKVKYSKNNYENCMVPYDAKKCDWLVVDEHLKILEKIPDMVARDPMSMPVWELEGDFIRSNCVWSWGSVSRNYISIRLPRFICVREDKSYRDATTILDLHLLSTISNKTFAYPELYHVYLQNNIKNFSLC